MAKRRRLFKRLLSTARSAPSYVMNCFKQGSTYAAIGGVVIFLPAFQFQVALFVGCSVLAFFLGDSPKPAPVVQPRRKPRRRVKSAPKAPLAPKPPTII